MTVRQALDKVTEILSTPQHPQIKGKLIEYGYAGNGEVIILGKCALGELSCRVGLPLKPHQPPPYHSTILTLTGFPAWMSEGNLPTMRASVVNKVNLLWFIDSCFEGKTIEGESHLSSYITLMNDYGFTYQQIIEFLETTFGDIED